MAIGDNHAAGLSCDGTLYTWGLNHKGQLGHNTREGSLLEPCQVGSGGSGDPPAPCRPAGTPAGKRRRRQRRRRRRRRRRRSPP
jgi:hypothetical protein